jgi:hypothetical protein
MLTGLENILYNDRSYYDPQHATMELDPQSDNSIQFKPTKDSITKKNKT